MKFRFEPAILIQTISAGLALLVTFGIPGLSADQAALIVATVAAILGVVTALKVRPIAPAIFTTLITAGAALLTGYGLDLSQEMIGAVQVFVVAVMTMLTRGQVSPAATTPAESVRARSGPSPY
jgi:hypothetical protein